MISTHRWPDPIDRKSQRIQKKATRANKGIQQVAGHKVNKQKSILFPYTNKEQTKK